MKSFLFIMCFFPHCEGEATKQSFVLLHPVIANRRVSKCAGVKQSPRCTFLLVLGVLRRLLRLIAIRLAMTQWACSLAMTLWGYRLAMTQWGCSLAMTPLSVIASSFLSVIASSSLLVIARSEATKQSPLLFYPVIANQRVCKSVGVKQSPHSTFLLVLGVLGGLLRSLRSLAMTVWGCMLAMTICEVFARNDEETIKACNNLMNVYR